VTGWQAGCAARRNGPAASRASAAGSVRRWTPRRGGRPARRCWRRQQRRRHAGPRAGAGGGGVPVLLALALWLPGRLRWRRDSRAAVALRDDVDLLALRAATSAPLPALAALGPQPVTRWRAGDADAGRALAALELERLGLRAPETSSYAGALPAGQGRRRAAQRRSRRGPPGRQPARRPRRCRSRARPTAPAGPPRPAAPRTSSSRPPRAPARSRCTSDSSRAR
jgi:hypothetical protein